LYSINIDKGHRNTTERLHVLPFPSQAYRRAFDNFDIAKVAVTWPKPTVGPDHTIPLLAEAYPPSKVTSLLKSPGEGSAVIVKNRGKIETR
jgi:hypothetical protein